MNYSLVALYVLFIFYCMVIAIKTFGSEGRFTWQPIKMPADDVLGTTATNSCTSDDECLSDEKCFLHAGQHRCVKTTTRDCNPNTGTFVLTKNTSNSLLLKCECKYPHLISQATDGTDCRIDVACGPHGHLNTVTEDPMLSSTVYCVCNEGFVFDRATMQCIKRTDGQQLDCYPFSVVNGTCDCRQPHYVSSDSLEAALIFDMEYLKQFSGRKRCLRIPCNFDAMNGGRMIHAGARIVYGLNNDTHCVCDPRYGLFGVRLETNNYLRDGGNNYNACASIFEEGGKQEPSVDVRVYCYFFINGREPICFTHFRNVSDVSHVFGTAHDLVISESWGPNNFFQQVLKHGDISSHTRECYQRGFLYSCNEHRWVENLRPNCKHVGYISKQTFYNDRFAFYCKVYYHPYCRTRDHDEHGVYKDTFILNPNMVTMQEYPDLLRSDGIELRPSDKSNKWLVDHAATSFHNWAHSVPQELGTVLDTSRTHRDRDQSEKDWRDTWRSFSYTDF